VGQVIGGRRGCADGMRRQTDRYSDPQIDRGDGRILAVCGDLERETIRAGVIGVR
jgi:hypothetical protein